MRTIPHAVPVTPAAPRMLHIVPPSARRGSMAGLFAALDALGHCIGVCDSNGMALEQTSRFREMTAGHPDGGAVQALILSTIGRMTAGKRSTEAASADHVVHISSCHIEGMPMYLVEIEAMAGPIPMPTDDELRRRFGLSDREASVGRLILCGKSNKSIAESLRISPHTARHHTENLLQKLQLRSRTEVAMKLLAPR